MILASFILLSGSAIRLDQSRILLCGKELRVTFSLQMGPRNQIVLGYLK